MGSLLAVPANSDARLDGKTAVITGANAGIGKITARDFYERGARVVLACRNLEKGQEALNDIRKECEGKTNLGELKLTKLDLSSLKSVRACAEELLKSEERINILLNNAGVMSIKTLTKTEDGNEMQFGTNHLGHFLFTLLLMPKLIQSAPGVRIVTISSHLHFMARSLAVDDLNYENRSYGANSAYYQSKLCNILFTKELARKLEENNIQGINVYTLHPGVIDTNLGNNVTNPLFTLSRMFFKTPEEGAQTSIYCSTHENCKNETGLYYAECKPNCSSKISKDKELAKKLWKVSLNMVGLNEDFDPFKEATPL